MSNPTVPVTDRFGHPIDPLVGYARGSILRGPVDDAVRKEHSHALMRRRLAALPGAPLFNFTGLHRNFLLTAADLDGGLAEEWAGPPRFTADLERLARRHMGASPEAAVAVNAAAQPGARVSLRLKPAPQEVERFGGVNAVLQAIDQGFGLVAELLHDEAAARTVILGDAFRH